MGIPGRITEKSNNIKGYWRSGRDSNLGSNHSDLQQSQRLPQELVPRFVPPGFLIDQPATPPSSFSRRARSVTTCRP